MTLRGQHTGRKTQGYREPDRFGVMTVSVRLHDEMFNEVRARSLRHKTTFADELRTLVEWALEDHPEV